MAEKIDVRCTCDKAYRVPRSKAGKRFKCKACGEQIEVPAVANAEEFTLSSDEDEDEEDAAVGDEEREAILRELGIDASKAEQEYEATRRRQERQSKAPDARHRCIECNEPMTEEDMAALKPVDPLVCRACTVTDRVDEHNVAKLKRKGVERWNRHEWSIEDAGREGKKFGAIGLVVGLVLAGIARQFMYFPIWVYPIVALAAGYAAYKWAYDSALPAPQDAGGKVTLEEVMASAKSDQEDDEG